ncbi:hypothetical protein K701_26455 [Streptomyces fradiae ATCC 10745 = DSM 40063]|uniref:Uncharacterized protein n=1 Tax=Streptomyces fradiae ATCC 10745 = DSM 40063 TaxID=1319510 RepID=A0ABQ6XM43_STRFR|nr:hypothetical protein K701_26455 [Streptomyces fradiae ATCC 10745 = DSM 40063]
MLDSNLYVTAFREAHPTGVPFGVLVILVALVTQRGQLE